MLQRGDISGVLLTMQLHCMEVDQPRNLANRRQRRIAKHADGQNA